MTRLGQSARKAIKKAGLTALPFADLNSSQLPFRRLLRLSLFQVSIGIAVALLYGTLNRVMIIELKVPASIVSLMIALPLVVAPFRALIGHRSDTYDSLIGWRRAPFVWFGTLMQFGGLAIMPFALMVLSTTTGFEAWIGVFGAAVAFLLVGAGMHTTQTAGLALATDLAPDNMRPQIVATLYVMLLLGTIFGSLGLGAFLHEFSPLRLIQVVQGAALLTIAFNVVALWKQERLDPVKTAPKRSKPIFSKSWREYISDRRRARFLLAVAVGTAAFSMQDILLEPYGADVLSLSVSATTVLTAIFAIGTLLGFLHAGFRLSAGRDSCRLSAIGVIYGVVGFTAIVFSAPFSSELLFRGGVCVTGFGVGVFSIGTLVYVMNHDDSIESGLALGIWGAVQATAAGLGIAAGGLVRDTVDAVANTGVFGDVLDQVYTGYMVVYQLELVLLFVTLIIIGPLVKPAVKESNQLRTGLHEFPG